MVTAGSCRKGDKAAGLIWLPKGSKATGDSGLAAERGNKAAEPYMAAKRAVRLLVAAGDCSEGGWGCWPYIAAERAVRLLVTAGWLQKGGIRLLSPI